VHKQTIRASVQEWTWDRVGRAIFVDRRDDLVGGGMGENLK
jgi:hypothetical protein